MQILCPFLNCNPMKLGEEEHIFEDYLRERDKNLLLSLLLLLEMEWRKIQMLFWTFCLSDYSPLSNAQLAHNRVWNFKVQKKRQKEDLKGLETMDLDQTEVCPTKYFIEQIWIDKVIFKRKKKAFKELF